MAEVASAFVSLMPSAKGFGRATESQIGGEMRTSGSRMGGVFGKALKVGALAGIAAVGAAFVSGFKDAVEYQKLQAQTAAVLKSTGGAANVTAKGITDLASKIAAYSDGNDDAVQSGANLLLTFTNIKNEAGRGNKIFDQTTKIMYDMSTALGQDTKSSALQLGKALNDPVKGVTALQRVGVSFTQAQKDQIKALVDSGKTMGAQKLILGELRKEFGGSAKAVGKTFAGAWGRLKDSMGDLLRDAVMPLLPPLTRLVDYLAKNLPGAVASAKATIENVIAAVTPFASAVVGVFNRIRGSMDGLGGSGGGLSSLRDAFLNVVDAVREFVNGALPIVQQFVAGMQQRLAPLLPKVQEVFRQIGSTVTDALNLIAAVVRVTLTVVQFVWQNFGSVIMGYVSGVFSAIVTAIQGALNIIQGVIRLVLSLIKGDWSGAWDALKQIVEGAWQIIQGVVSAALNMMKSVLAAGWVVIKGAAKLAWDGIKKIPELALAAVVAIVRAELNIVKSVAQAAWNGIKAAAQAVWGAIKSYISTQVGAIKAAVGGLSDLVGKVRGYFQNIVDAIEKKLGDAVAKVKAFPGDAARALGDLTQTLYSYGRNLIVGFINGIKDKAGEIVGAVTGPISSAIKGVGSLLKIGSPSKLFHQIGKWTMEGFENGIKEAGPKVLKAMQTALENTLSKVDAFRDGVASRLDSIKSAFSSLKDSIASAFAGDLFNVSAIASSLTETTFTAAQTVGQAFTNNLMDTKGQLQELLKAFRKLKRWGLPSQFLSQLFASGNSALILEMAGGTRTGAQSAAALFGDVQSLSQQLGGQVARNQYGEQISGLDAKLARIDRHTARLEHLAKDIGREINNAAAASRRDKRGGAAE